MFEELLPAGLTRAARQLGVEPLEIVRLMVQTDTVTPGFVVNADHRKKLAAAGQIESNWWDGLELPDDTSPARQRVRATLHLLLTKGGDAAPVRMDNLWRGLPVDDQAVIEDALNVLADEEIVVIQNAIAGVQVVIPAERAALVRELANGTAKSPGLDQIYG